MFCCQRLKPFHVACFCFSLESENKKKPSPPFIQFSAVVAMRDTEVDVAPVYRKSRIGKPPTENTTIDQLVTLNDSH